MKTTHLLVSFTIIFLIFLQYFVGNKHCCEHTGVSREIVRNLVSNIWQNKYIIVFGSEFFNHKHSYQCSENHTKILIALWWGFDLR